jgi:hypothetical protein
MNNHISGDGDTVIHAPYKLQFISDRSIQNYIFKELARAYLFINTTK